MLATREAYAILRAALRSTNEGRDRRRRRSISAFRIRSVTASWKSFGCFSRTDRKSTRLNSSH